MKKIAISAIAAATLLTTGCNFLDVDPVGKVIASKTSEYRAMLTGGYNKYPAIEGRGFNSLLADEVGSLATDNIFSPVDRESMPYTYTWQYSGAMRDFEWQFYYSAIFYANVIIEQVMDATVDSSDTREQLLAEAYALRAYCHMELVNLYGKWFDPATAATDKAVPVSGVIDIEQQYIPASVAQVYASILADIENSLKFMEVESQTEPNLKYRFSKMAVKALESRVRLYTGDWQKALDAAMAVIPSYTLTDFNAMATVSKDEPTLPWKIGSKENILALDAPFGGLGGDYLASAMLSDNMLALFNDQDLRRKLLKEVTIFDMNTFEDVVIGTGLVRDTKDKCSFRVAELYLTAAEAAARIGTDDKVAQARTLLLQLQKNRFSPDGYTAKATAVNAMNSADLLTEIMNERAREFVMEGHRWFDLRRTTRPAIVKTFDGSTHTLQQNDSRYTVPYPRVAVENNPRLAD
jgi:hypothetical protein